MGRVGNSGVILERFWDCLTRNYKTRGARARRCLQGASELRQSSLVCLGIGTLLVVGDGLIGRGRVI